MKDFGDDVGRAAFAEDTVGFAVERIGGVAVGEREIVGGKQMLVVLIVSASGGCETMVEKSQAATGDMRNDAVENLAALLVGVEPFPEEMPEAAAALRGAEADGAVDDRF